MDRRKANVMFLHLQTLLQALYSTPVIWFLHR